MKTAWKKIHNWLGISSALFLIILLVTGVLLNHPSLLKEKEAKVLAAHPNEDKIFYGGKDGLYVSMDAGRSWEEVPMLYPPQEVVDIAFKPQSPEEVYLLEKWGRIYRSKDGGRVWDIVPVPFDAQKEGIELKKLSVSSKGKLLLFTSHGWLTSVSGGTDWDLAHFNQDRNSFHRVILTLHNGYFFGPAFVWLYDFAAVALLVLIVTGLVLWKIGRSVA